MAQILSIARVLGFKDFFPSESPKAKEFYARTLGKDLVQQICCFFLGYLRHQNIPSIEQLMAEWFTFYGHQYQNSPSYLAVEQEYRRIKLHSPPGEQHELISAEALLNLFLWTLTADIPEKIEVVDASSTLRSFELLLLFNDDVLVNYAKVIESIKGREDDRHIQRLIFTSCFPQSDLVNVDYAQLLFSQIYKLSELLTFLESHDRYLPLLQKLLSNFGCSSSNDYLKSVGSAILQPLTNHRPGWSVLQIRVDDDNKEKSQRILDNLALPMDTMVPHQQDDYLPLRNAPFQKISEAQYRLIFDLFLIKKLYNGTIFNLSRYDKNFLSDVRSDFSEGVLVYDTLRNILPSVGTVRITGEKFKAENLEREPDYYFRHGHEIILFESKDFFMTGKEKLSYDFDIIEGGLKKEGRLLKAVIQLSTNIQRCINKMLPLDNAYDPKEILIYPVIIVHDSLYSAPGLNFWIHYWLQDELSKLKIDPQYKDFNFSRIVPLTIIEIDTLILYQEILSLQDPSLLTLIKCFHKRVRYNAVGHLRPKEIENHAKISALSFSEFVRECAHRSDVQIDFKVIIEKLKHFGIQ